MFAETRIRRSPQFETSDSHKSPIYHSHGPPPSSIFFKRVGIESRWHVSEVRRAVMQAFETRYYETLKGALKKKREISDRFVLDMKSPKPDKFYMFELGGIPHAVRLTRDGYFEIYEVESV